MASGVYAIRRITDGKYYVGSSVDIRRRWASHSASLIAGEHHSIWLQRSRTRHGADAHEFIVLEECEPIKVVLITREQHYIDALRQRVWERRRAAESRAA